MTLALLSAVANHLWQSTVVLAVVCGLAWVLRRNRAEARFWLWFAASAKFLVPFAVLVDIGQVIGWPSPTVLPRPALSNALDALQQPFAFSTASLWASSPSPAAVQTPAVWWPGVLIAIWSSGVALLLIVWAMRSVRVAAIVRSSAPLLDAHLIARLRRAEQLVGPRRPVRAVISDDMLEPGVFGIVCPVLVWPRAIASRLSGSQIDAVLTHELAHVRRHDNLTAMIHMVVEAVFWFFPAVWWLERQLVRERELACDAVVVQLGSDPESYAEGILRTCELCVKSPLVCVAGVTGADLKQRVVAIVRGHAGEALGAGRRVIIIATSAAVIAMPVVLGVLQAPLLRAQVPAVAQLPAFEVASIKVNKSGQQGGSFGPRGSQLVVINYVLFDIIRNAYGLQGNQILGGPDWIRAEGERFDITAKAPEGTKPDQLLLMMQQLVADRFKVRLHKETREVPMFALVMARADRRLGPQMKPAAFDCAALRAAIARGEQPPRPPQTGDRPACGAQTRPGRFLVGGYPLADFARNLSSFVGGRPIVDRTGLTGIYDLELTWTPDQQLPPVPLAPASDPNGPSLFTAVQEQLGLKLEATTGPVEVLVIDSAERPTED